MTGIRPNRSEEDLVRKIFDLDRRIKFCAIADKDGILVAGGMRPGAKSLEPRDQTSLIVLRTTLASQAARASDDHLGRTRFGIIRRDRVLQILLRLPEGRGLQIAADVSFPVERVKLIERAIKKLVSPTYYS